MRIFLSWSGEQSKAVALALRDWLPLLLQRVEPWMSAAEIGAGQRWGEQIAENLRRCEFGIICCTRDNVAAPWLLFEAGALANALAADAVCPLLLGISFSDLDDPLAQFQAKKLDREGIMELALSINRKSGHPLPDGHLHELFGALWPLLQVRLDGVPACDGEPPPARPTAAVLEDLVATIRRLDQRVQALAARRPTPHVNSERAHMWYPDLDRVPVEQLREFAGAMVRESSLREAAGRAGLGHEAVRKFVNGTSERPHLRMLRALASWYLLETAAGRYPRSGAAEESN
jgi:TIR domain